MPPTATCKHTPSTRAAAAAYLWLRSGGRYAHAALCTEWLCLVPGHGVTVRRLVLGPPVEVRVELGVPLVSKPKVRSRFVHSIHDQSPAVVPRPERMHA
jgi:hypothetical protein